MIQNEQASRDRWSAVGLCLLLMTGWTVFGWDRLVSLWLPDTDDMMRIQQVRDWMAGQGFKDLTQHRLSPPDGLVMHWSRIADLLPAALILVLTPAIGLYMANVWAVILVPGLLFLAYLLAILRLYREIDMDGDAVPLLVIAALAFPVMGLFQPGRVDHHGLQMVLLALAASAVVGRSLLVNGVILGLSVATSLAIGLETAPFLVALLGCQTVFWLTEGSEERARMIATGGTLAAATLVYSQLFIANGNPPGWCDAFTLPVAIAAMAGGGVIAFLGAVSGLSNIVLRGAVALVLATGLGYFLYNQYPGCMANPYALVDSVVAHQWLANVEEAQGLLSLGVTRATIGHAGLVIAGLLATLGMLGMAAEWRRPVFVLFIGLATSLLLMTFQLRAAYAGAVMAVVPLALMVNAARERGPLLLIPAWLVSIGLIYDQAPRFIPQIKAAKVAETALTGECASPSTMAALAKTPKMRLIAPMDVGAYAIGATLGSVYAAPYHRNNHGNRLMFDILFDQHNKAAALARKNGVTHILVCPSAQRAPQETLAAQLANGHAPGWVKRVPLPKSAALLYRVR